MYTQDAPINESLRIDQLVWSRESSVAYMYLLGFSMSSCWSRDGNKIVPIIALCRLLTPCATHCLNANIKSCFLMAKKFY